MNDHRHPSLIGTSVLRVEDARLLRGAGRFLHDIDLIGALHAAFVRSPLAHALIKTLDLDKARALPGVRAVLSYDDLRPLLANARIPLAIRTTAIRFDVDPPVLAQHEVCYVGEPIALVLAQTRQIAE